MFNHLRVLSLVKDKRCLSRSWAKRSSVSSRRLKPAWVYKDLTLQPSGAKLTNLLHARCLHFSPCLCDKTLWPKQFNR